MALHAHIRVWDPVPSSPPGLSRAALGAESLTLGHFKDY